MSQSTSASTAPVLPLRPQGSGQSLSPRLEHSAARTVLLGLSFCSLKPAVVVFAFTMYIVTKARRGTSWLIVQPKPLLPTTAMLFVVGFLSCSFCSLTLRLGSGFYPPLPLPFLFRILRLWDHQRPLLMSPPISPSSNSMKRALASHCHLDSPCGLLLSMSVL